MTDSNGGDYLLKLVKKRDCVARRIVRTANSLRNVVADEGGELSVDAAQIDRDDLERCFHQFEAVQNEIEEEVSGDELEAQETERARIETLVRQAKVSASNFLRRSIGQLDPNNSNSAAVTVPSTKIKRPEITVPKFSGDVKKWSEFKNVFKSLVIDEKLYSDVERMIYLKQAVEGKAAEVIANFEISKQNFSKAWEKLRRRYENRKAVISNHLETLCNLPFAKSETEVAPLLDAATDAIESLSAAGVENGWELMLCHLVSSKLDAETRKQWELSIVQDDEYPTYAKLELFLQQRVRAFESIGLTSVSSKSSAVNVKKEKTEKSKSFLLKENERSSVKEPGKVPSSCFDCGASSHSIAECQSFIAKSIPEKTKVIQRRGLCFNCLNRGHRVAFYRLKRCEKCSKRHHILLHRDEPKQQSVSSSPKSEMSVNSPEKPENSSSSSTPVNTKSFLVSSVSASYVCLPAALVYVFGTNGNRYIARAFLDSGGGINVISEKLARKLRCKFESSNVTVSTLMPGQFSMSHSCIINVKSRINAFNFSCKFQVAPSIATDFSGFEKATVDSELLKGCQLADDPKINSGQVDLLLGAEFYEEFMRNGKIKVGDKAYLRESEFGWVFIGIAKSVSFFDKPSSCYLTLETNFQRFWSIDEIFEVKSSWTEEERRVDEEFERTFTQAPEGKFLLFYPKNLTEDMLGESRTTAFRRLLSQEKRLSKVEEVRKDYNAFLLEYEELEHMTEIGCSEALVYLPHHAVLREDSLTARTRVVFNAATPTSSGYSLNDFLAKGPVLQEDLLSILMRFRTYKVAFTADIEKMYRQVLIRPEDRKFQCILWRKPEASSIGTFRLNTLTYGTKSASYLATKCLFKLAKLFAERYPRSAEIVQSDFYMDDLLSGADNVEDAKVRIKEIREILNSACFPLRKFASNSSEALSDLDPNLVVQSLAFEDIETISVLGIKWTSSDGDRFRIFNKLSVGKDGSMTTKRSFLSKIFRVYDPLGLLAPIVVSLKLLMQELWRCKIGWDDPVPESIIERFQRICSELEVLQSFTVPRCVEYSNQSEIHIFCDASQRAYGTAVYIRSMSKEGEFRVHLLCSKSRIAPIKTVSIPRLELCAALLGVKLFVKVKKALRLPDSSVVYAWSVSTIVLSWIFYESGNWSTFVVNRVSEIRSVIRPERWFHIRSEDNAADVISRGLESEFSRLEDFWIGPSFLRKSVEYSREVDLDPNSLVESKVKVNAWWVQTRGDLFFERFSRYDYLISFVAYVMRILKTLRDERYESLELSVFERSRAHKILVRKVQKAVGDKLMKLDCFADGDGIWRLRSQIGKSELTFESRYPVILPKGRFLLLLIGYWHNRFFHAGVTFLKNFIRASYHVLGDLNRTIRGVIYGCPICRRFSQKCQYSPPIGELPAYRVTVSQAFAQVGVDFAGPFQTRAVGPSRNKGKVLFKSYVAIFICMVSRAVHIEVVEDLSTKSFLDCFNRFISRRGLCHTVFSDHGTNFVGANHELRVAFEFMKQNRSEFVSHCSKIGIDWKFIPKRAPHFGGLWEAAVKSFKFHFKRVVGSQILSFSELSTLSCRIEAILNSRPICTSSDNLSTVITPAHLCIGKSLAVIPPICGEVVKGAIKVRYSMVHSIFERFWVVWRQEYLIALRSCYFKKHGSKKAQENDIVLLKEDNCPPAEWPMGRIVKCFPGDDGICRVVDVFVNGKVMRRPVVKLVPLLPEIES